MHLPTFRVIWKFGATLRTVITNLIPVLAVWKFPTSTNFIKNIHLTKFRTMKVIWKFGRTLRTDVNINQVVPAVFKFPTSILIIIKRIITIKLSLFLTILAILKFGPLLRTHLINRVILKFGRGYL